MNTGDIDLMLARYRRLKFRDPKPEEDPMIEQLSVLKDLLKPPSPSSYVDFCLWGPRGTRPQRAMKFDGLQLALDGTLVRKQTLGPPDFLTWRSCFVAYATAMIMLG